MWKWRKRDSVDDRSHTAHRLQTTLTPAQGSSVKRSIRWIDRSEERRRCTASDPAGLARRPCVRGARVPEPECVALRAGSLLASARCRQPTRSQVQDTAAEAQRLQDLRARLHPHRREVSTSDGGRVLAPVSVRGDRPGHSVGLHPHLQGQDRGQCAAIPAGPGARLPDADPDDPHG